MKALRALGAAALVVAAVASVGAAHPDATDRRVAITVDDLPVISTRRDIAHWREVTTGVLSALEKHRAPAVGFVNEDKLLTSSEVDSARFRLLWRWLNAGHELGNHTWSHPSLHRTPVPEYIADISRGALYTRVLLGLRGKPLRYFRHPFLHTGLSLDVRREVDDYLRLKGYTVAPVTIDNQDWIYARAWDNARDAGDRAAMKRVAGEYLPYMERVAEFWERQSVAILGREIPQVLLVHANDLNANRLDALLAMYRRRGYRFITLEEALRDSAYASRDSFVGNAGISWIHRWALTRKVPKETYRGEPEAPPYIVKLSGGR